MKTTLAPAIALGLILALPMTAAAGEAQQAGTSATQPPAKSTVSEQDIRELATRYYADAVKALEAGHLRAARTDLRCALRLDPTLVEAKTMLQIVEKKLGITDADRIRERLKAPVTRVDFTKAPVREVVEFVARKADVNVVFDASALQLLAPAREQAQQPAFSDGEQPEVEEAKGEPEAEAPPAEARQPAGPPRTDLITIHLKNVPLREVLRYVLRFKGLKYIVEDYAIVIVPVDWVPDDGLVTEIFRLTASGVQGNQIRDWLTNDADSRRSGGY